MRDPLNGEELPQIYYPWRQNRTRVNVLTGHLALGACGTRTRREGTRNCYYFVLQSASCHYSEKFSQPEVAVPGAIAYLSLEKTDIETRRDHLRNNASNADFARSSSALSLAT
jgi:hypothetical protein